jgi:hypothetical protein
VKIDVLQIAPRRVAHPRLVAQCNGVESLPELLMGDLVLG